MGDNQGTIGGIEGTIGGIEGAIMAFSVCCSILGINSLVLCNHIGATASPELYFTERPSPTLQLGTFLLGPLALAKPYGGQGGSGRDAPPFST